MELIQKLKIFIIIFQYGIIINIKKVSAANKCVDPIGVASPSYADHIIDHITSIGTPVYKQGNEKVGDHNLDALNLSLVAFTLEMSAFGVVSYDNTISFSGNIGEMTDKPVIGTPQQPNNKLINSKPNLQRTSVFSPNFASRNPAHNTLSGGRQLWSWPGFEKDAPRPNLNSRSSRRSGPPSRKKF